MRRTLGFLALAGFIGCIVAANAALDHWGLIAIGFGLLAPAGVYFAGLTFTLRDFGQEAAGRPAMFGAIAVGALLSAFVSPSLALASGTAFAFGEVADWLVYEPLRERSWRRAVVLSGLVGSFVDSVLFLWLAPLPATVLTVTGLVVGKMIATALFLMVLDTLRPSWRVEAQ